MEDISIKELVFVGCSIYEKKNRLNGYKWTSRVIVENVPDVQQARKNFDRRSQAEFPGALKMVYNCTVYSPLDR